MCALRFKIESPGCGLRPYPGYSLRNDAWRKPGVCVFAMMIFARASIESHTPGFFGSSVGWGKRGASPPSRHIRRGVRRSKTRFIGDRLVCFFDGAGGLALRLPEGGLALRLPHPTKACFAHCNDKGIHTRKNISRACVARVSAQRAPGINASVNVCASIQDRKLRVRPAALPGLLAAPMSHPISNHRQLKP
jgi:hypothetical protein